ncbi:MAG: long-chain fatty acid--CoA ligase [Candidatus Bathyarchaeota archaeon]|nr:MAG: long-chain fatty acid--CoA ligase [Candidatus Bathyarchaeota archaeon]
MVAENKTWFSSWPPEVPKSIEYPQIPLHAILTKTTKDNPKKTALAYFENEINYAELDSLSNQFAGALVKLGVKKGDRVAVFLPNTPQFVIAYFGSLKAGALLTAISPLHKERKVEYQLTDSEAETIIALDSLYPIVEKVWRKAKLKNAIITTLEDYASKTAISPSLVGQKPNVYSFQELLKEKGTKPPKVNINPKEDLAALQYTGGTTGTAKGAMLTHMNLVSNTVMFAAWIKGAVAQETFLTTLPLFHIYGMTTSMNVPILLAAKIVLLPRFETMAALESIQRHRVTVFCGVPTMYSVLLANPELGKFDLTSIRVCISGASPLPPHVQKKFMGISGGFLAEGYGLTEASPVTHCNPVDKTMRTVRLGSIGLPLPDTDAKIVDVETGVKTLEPGGTGELAVKGPQVMKGYWKRRGETALVLHDGWLLTGDIAKMDQDGYFYITDRKKDLIKYKDYSVYPRELEDVIYEHSAVKLCAVVGKPSPPVGEIPKAFIVLKDRAKATEAEVMAFVKEKVAPYKAIREVEFRKQLPLSSVGKVLRRVLHDEEKRKAA